MGAMCLRVLLCKVARTKIELTPPITFLIVQKINEIKMLKG